MENKVAIEWNSVDQLVSFKNAFQQAIIGGAVMCLRDRDLGWESLDELIEAAEDASEGFDIDLFCPAMQAAGMPSSGEYDNWTAPLGGEGHHIMYVWSWEALHTLKQTVLMGRKVEQYRKLQNPGLYS